MRALITGVNGFVGKYLTKELIFHGYEVIGVDIAGECYRHVNLLNPDAVSQLMRDTKPDYVFHLAGQSSVGLSWKIPKETFETNVCGTINLLNAIKAANLHSRVLIIGSSDQYGIVKPQDCPIAETLKLKPVNPYAISKYSQELIALSLAKSLEIDVIATRSFNHIGPGQRTGFVVTDFCSAIAQIESVKKEPTLQVGNLDAKRDFTDVRDVVHAYRLLSEKGISGETYNIGSGKAIPISEILSTLLSLSKAEIKISQDAEKIRPSDLPLIVCNYNKLQKDTGWEPSYNIKDTLKDVLDYYRLLENQ